MSYLAPKYLPKRYQNYFKNVVDAFQKCETSALKVYEMPDIERFMVDLTVYLDLHSGLSKWQALRVLSMINIAILKASTESIQTVSKVD